MKKREPARHSPITSHDATTHCSGVRLQNRIWQWTFGKPLVGTPNDFGRMGMLPTHPELLDALAARLRDDPTQSIKSMIRVLVHTNAYRRASSAGNAAALMAQNAAIDASNNLLWRFNRRRLTAEEFRDTVFAVSSALRVDQRGGTSFKDFVVEHPQHSPHYEYHLHDPDDPASHRRTIYRFVVRSQPHPMLTTLDCADPSISIARRDESTTALQALAQWNNRLVVAMSKRFAARLDGADRQRSGCNRPGLPVGMGTRRERCPTRSAGATAPTTRKGNLLQSRPQRQCDDVS